MRSPPQFIFQLALCVPALADWRDRASSLEHHDIKAVYSPLLEEEHRPSSEVTCWRSPQPGKEAEYLGDGWKYQNWLPSYVGALDSIEDSSSADCLKCFRAAYYGKENRISSFLAIDKLSGSDWGVAFGWDIIDFISNGEVKKGESFNMSITPADIDSCGMGPTLFEEYKHTEL